MWSMHPIATAPAVIPVIMLMVCGLLLYRMERKYKENSGEKLGTGLGGWNSGCGVLGMRSPLKHRDGPPGSRKRGIPQLRGWVLRERVEQGSPIIPLIAMLTEPPAPSHRSWSVIGIPVLL